MAAARKYSSLKTARDDSYSLESFYSDFSGAVDLVRLYFHPDCGEFRGAWGVAREKGLAAYARLPDAQALRINRRPLILARLNHHKPPT